MKETKASILEASARLFELCKQFDAEVQATDPTKERRPCAHMVIENIYFTGDLSDKLELIIKQAELRKSVAAKLSPEEAIELGFVPKVAPVAQA